MHKVDAAHYLVGNFTVFVPKETCIPNEAVGDKGFASIDIFTSIRSIVGMVCIRK